MAGGGGGPVVGGKSTSGVPTLSGGSMSGLKRRRPNVTFTARAGRGAPKLRSLLIGLPAGLDFVLRRVHHRLRILDVRVRGARGSLPLRVRTICSFIRLRSPAARVTSRSATARCSESLGLVPSELGTAGSKPDRRGDRAQRGR